MADGKPIAVVAGVGPGLGAALCRALARSGYVVVALARTGGFTQDLAHELRQAGNSLVSIQCDVGDTESVDAAFARIDHEVGAASVYIHNASQLVAMPSLELSAAAFTDAWRVACLGALLCAQKVIPGMLQRGRGTLLFTGATGALRGGAGFAAFASAKFALRGLAQSLAREFGPRGIHVAHVVIDGLIWSGQIRRGFTRDQCLLPEAIADCYMQLIAQDRSAWTQELDLRPDVEKF
ncbi:MAG: SDR family NAD(P)-dependent oxidoreductase [Gammaproteobacteria bacterium]|nr:SDR family NAD(P)-dependent oxidoreductase [Gammaproteobacteria bacterium]